MMEHLFTANSGGYHAYEDGWHAKLVTVNEKLGNSYRNCSDPCAVAVKRSTF